MKIHDADPLPTGVRAIAVLFALCGIYLGIAGAIMLLGPGTISMHWRRNIRLLPI